MSERCLASLAEDYGLAVGNFLVQYDEASRLRAYEMGRQALADGVGLLDIVTIHHLALNMLLQHATVEHLSTWLARAGEFLGECLGPFEMSQRGYQEANREMQRMIGVLRQRNEDISRANQDLEAFSYSVAHDLRAPLRSIDGFSRILQRDHADQLDESGRQYLQLVSEAAKRMGLLMEDLLNLARISRTDMRFQALDLAALARETMQRLEHEQPERRFRFVAPERLPAQGDPTLLGAVMENLLGNAWKYSRRRETAEIELGRKPVAGAPDGAFFVRDNGAGFDMSNAGKLFKVFQRLHSVAEFEGTGVGLAIVQRIVERHGGRVWAEAVLDQGATFYFTLPEHENAAVTPPT